jgi:hypothetical protein
MNKLSVLKATLGAAAVLTFASTTVFAATSANHNVEVTVEGQRSIAWNDAEGGLQALTTLHRDDSGIAVGTAQQLNFSTDYADKVTVTSTAGVQGGITLKVLASALTITDGTDCTLPTATCAVSNKLTFSDTDPQNLVTGLNGATSRLAGNFHVAYDASASDTAVTETKRTWTVTYDIVVTP